MFLNGDLEEEVYIDTLLGFDNKFGAKVCKLKKSLYGLKQSLKAWFQKFTWFVKNNGYIQAQTDHTMFIKHSSDGRIVVLIVYVDNIILTGDDVSEMNQLKRCSTSEFEIKDLGPLRYFFGMKVAQSKKGIVVSQEKYVLDILKEIGMSNCRPVDTLMDHNQKLRDIKKGDPIDKAQY